MGQLSSFMTLFIAPVSIRPVVWHVKSDMSDVGHLSQYVLECTVYHEYLLESNYSCLWKHVENNLFLSNFMKISSPSLNIFYNLFYFRGFFPTQIHIEILNHISHTCKIMCTKKHNSAEGWKYWKRKQHTYKTKKNNKKTTLKDILW
jgi:hypothetical protein